MNASFRWDSEKRLTDEELRELCRRRDAGRDEDGTYDADATAALWEIVTRNLPLARLFGKRFACRAMPAEDAEAEAILGLRLAAERFDPALGTKFSTCAFQWVRQSCQRAQEAVADPIRLPSHIRDDIRRYLKARRADRLASRDESIEAVAGNPTRAAMLRRGLAAARPAFPVVRPTREDNPGNECVVAADGPSPADAAEAAEERAIVRRLIDALGASRNATILRWRLGIDTPTGGTMTFGEIGAALGISKEMVRQLEIVQLQRLAKTAQAAGIRGITPELVGSLCRPASAKPGVRWIENDGRWAAYVRILRRDGRRSVKLLGKFATRREASAAWHAHVDPEAIGGAA